MQPSNEDELTDMLWSSLNTKAPTFIRYPRGKAEGVAIKETPEILEIGKAKQLRKGDGKVCIWALGNMVGEAIKVADAIKAQHSVEVGVVDARFVKPLDTELLLKTAEENEAIITLEDHVKAGGFGSAIAECLLENNKNCKLEMIGWPDVYIPHGTDVATIRNQFGLGTEQLIDSVCKVANLQ